MGQGESSPNTLDEQLCFALHTATRAIMATYRPGLDAIGLTYSQYLVMLVLWEHGPVSIGALGELLNMDSGTLSPLVKRLEAQEIVTRRRRSDDERVVEVEATSAGAALYEPAREVQARVATATGLSRNQLVAMRDELCDLAGRLRAHNAAGAGDVAEVG